MPPFHVESPESIKINFLVSTPDVVPHLELAQKNLQKFGTSIEGNDTTKKFPRLVPPLINL